MLVPRLSITVLISLLLCLPVFAPLAAQAAIVPDTGVFAAAKTGELLVQFRGNDQPTVLQFADNLMAAKALQEMADDKNVIHAQPNFVYTAAALANDPLTEEQTYLELIDAYRAWDITTSAKDVVVAVIDSGVDIDHPDLRGNVWTNIAEKPNSLDDDGNGLVDDIHGWDFLERLPDPRPKFEKGIPENSIGIQHGTGVAGIIAGTGNNGLGIAGVAWQAQLMSLRVLSQFGTGNSQTVTQALRYAIEKKVDVINLSLVGTSYDELVVGMLDEAYEQGIIVVAAAGNNGVNLNVSETYPVCYNHRGEGTIIGVGAITDDFTRPGFSNYGSDCVDIVAPGVKIFTARHTEPGFESQEQYAALFSGTSFAAPQVTGVITLMKAMKPSLTADETLYLLQQGSSRLGEEVSATSGYTFALNAAGSLALLAANDDIDPSEPIDDTPPLVVPASNEFLAFPRGPYGPVAYQYQMPGPILLSPVVFGDEALQPGIRMTKEGKHTFLVSAWRPSSKRIWRYNAANGEFSELFMIPVGDPQTVGSVAVGNIDFDADNEYVVAATVQGKPLVSVYNERGALKFQFQAYPDAINGGLDVDLVDINKDGLMEIVTVPVSQTSGLVRVFEYTGLKLAEFNAYGPNFRGGASLSAVDVDGDGIRDLLVGPGAGGGPHVKIFKTDGTLMQEFFAGEVRETSGALVDYYDLDGDRQKEFVISYHQGHYSILRTYSPQGVFKQELGVFDPKFKGAIGVVPL